MKFSIGHELNVSAEQLWKNLFVPELEKSVATATKLKEFVVDTKDEGSTLKRNVRVVPNVELPGPLKAIMGSTIGYREVDIVPKTGGMEYKWSVTTDALPDKIHVSGTFRVEPLGPNRCRRVIDGEVTVKIFGLGGLAEKFFVSQLQENYALVSQEQERWIRAQGNA